MTYRCMKFVVESNQTFLIETEWDLLVAACLVPRAPTQTECVTEFRNIKAGDELSITLVVEHIYKCKLIDIPDKKSILQW